MVPTLSLLLIRWIFSRYFFGISSPALYVEPNSVHLRFALHLLSELFSFLAFGAHFALVQKEAFSVSLHETIDINYSLAHTGVQTCCTPNYLAQSSTKIHPGPLSPLGICSKTFPALGKAFDCKFSHSSGLVELRLTIAGTVMF